MHLVSNNHNMVSCYIRFCISVFTKEDKDNLPAVKTMMSVENTRYHFVSASYDQVKIRLISLLC